MTPADPAEQRHAGRAEREAREARWRAQCRELAIRHVTTAIELLEHYLAGGDSRDLDQARKQAEIAHRTASQPMGVVIR